MLRHVGLFGTPWTAAHGVFLSITNYRSLLKLVSIESVMPSNHLILLTEDPLLPPSVFPSIGVFTNESILHLKGGQSIGVLNFSISRSNDYSGLISFRRDWLE